MFRKRAFWYAALGVIPSAPLAFLMASASGVPSFLAVAGFIGLCAACFVSPSLKSFKTASVVAMLLCGLAITTYVVINTAPLVFANPASFRSDAPLWAMILLPALVALHYVFMFVAALWPNNAFKRTGFARRLT